MAMHSARAAAPGKIKRLGRLMTAASQKTCGSWPSLFGDLEEISHSSEVVNAMARRPAGEHVYIRGDVMNRGPCPAMNALANQGYLPRDGKNLTIPQVEVALREAFSMTPVYAAMISRQLKKIVDHDGTFDLRDMRQHGAIEHDKSFTRLDARQGDNYTFQPAMFQAMLDDADGGPVTVKTLAKTYRRRSREHRECGGERLGVGMWLANLVQSVSFLTVAQTGSALSRDMMTTFYTEERIPDEVLNNKTPRTLWGLVKNVVKLLYHICT